MVRHSTGVPVHAFDARLCRVGAAICALAGVFGAAILVVAKLYQATVHQTRFVNVAITVIVEAVTEFSFRQHGIAVGEASIHTDSLAGATPEFVGCLAVGPKRQCHRLCGARADSRISHALHCADIINRDRRQT